MPLSEAGLLVLETALNKVLELDPEIASKFAGLHGQVIGFELLGTGLTLFFIPAQNGQLQITGRYDDQPDCLVSGTLPSLLRSHIENKPDQVFSGDIKISGNAGLAQKFTRILRALDFDWEEQLSKFTGDIVAHQVGDTFRAAGHWLKSTSGTAGVNLQEYLQEELRLTPSGFELDDFFADVDLLREDTDRLEARIKRLQSRRTGSD